MSYTKLIQESLNASEHSAEDAETRLSKINTGNEIVATKTKELAGDYDSALKSLLAKRAAKKQSQKR